MDNQERRNRPIGRALRELTERVLKVTILTRVPFGYDAYRDMRLHTRWSPEGVLFDVGANVGQTTIRMAANCPAAAIYAFEPAHDTYRELVQRTKHLPNVHHVQMAFGASAGQAQLFHGSQSTCHTLKAEAVHPLGAQSETVEVTTIDAFMRAEQIPFIQFLKIDTEGYDLEVLKGAEHALAEGKIGAVQIEAGLGQDEGKFVRLEVFQSHFAARDFGLLGIYGQAVQGGRLRRCDAVFIADSFGLEPSTGGYSRARHGVPSAAAFPP